MRRPSSAPSRVARRAALSAIVALGACRGDAPAASDSPWTITRDSTADTIRVRVDGEVPEAMVHRLVAELRVGALEGAEEVTFGSIDAVSGTRDGGLLVYDGDAQAVRLFDSTGAFVRQVGRKGGGPGEHGHLNGLAMAPNGDWIFWDAPGGRLNRYNHAGDFLGQVRLSVSGWFLQDGLTANADGTLAVWTMLKRGDRGEIAEAGYVVLDAAGGVRDTLVVPMWGPEPATLSAQTPDGGSTTSTTLPWGGGSDARPTPLGGLLAGPGGHYVFYLLPPSGKPTRVERGYAPVPVSSTESSERRAQIEQTMRRLDPSWNWTGPDIPSTKPAYRELQVGEDGRAWVRLYTPGEPIPADELPVPEPGAPPRVVLTTREPPLFDVFAPNGDYLGRVRPPARTRLLRMRGNAAWGVERDSLDVPYAVRYRIEPPLPPG